MAFDDSARLEIMNKSNIRDLDIDSTRTGYSHIAFSVGTKERVNSLTEQLRVDGYEVIFAYLVYVIMTWIQKEMERH